MKFPSLKTLAKGVENTIERFPFEMLFAVIGTTAAIINTVLEDKSLNTQNWCIRVMFIADLGLLFNLATTLFTNGKAIKRITKISIKFIAALLALSLIFLLNPSERASDYFRFILFSLSFHLLVSFSAFTNKDHIQGFWQFNKTIFLRFLTSILYSVVLYIGLAAALAASNFLFNLKIEWRTYVVLWYCIVGIFNTLFFLAGVPAYTSSLDNDFSYPKGLKIFTQYVLIPLTTIYVLILLAYEGKLIIQWSLPKGMVSNLILGHAVFGILSILLIYPIREQEDNKWIKRYARSFYFLLIPLLILLFLASGRRIFAYGITEERYFLLILASWLLFITCYFLISKKQNIKVIPVSLCLLTLLSIYGPQSAFSVSTYSQRHILLGIFKSNSAFKDGKLISVKSKINAIDGNNAIEKLKYLINNKGLSTLQPYINVNLDSIADSLDYNKGRIKKYYNYDKYELNNRELDWVRSYLGLDHVPDRVDITDVYSNKDSYKFTSVNKSAVDVRGYDFVLSEISTYGYVAKSNIGNIVITEKKDDNNQYTISVNNEQVIFDLKGLADSLITPVAKLKSYIKDNRNDDDLTAIQSFVVPENTLSITKQTAHYLLTFKFSHMMFNSNLKSKTQITNMKGWCLIKKK